MRKLSLWCAAALLPLLAACSFSLLPRTEYTEPKTFDLISPSPIDELPFIIDVDAFSTECSGRYKMVFREEANRVSVDEYSRWSMPPGAMLTKYLSARFASPSNNQGREKKPGFELDGTVLSCELNKATMQVDLMIHYFIVEPGKEEFRITGTEDYSIPVNETTPEAFADGFDQAAAKFAEHIVYVLTKEISDRASDAKKPAEK